MAKRSSKIPHTRYPGQTVENVVADAKALLKLVPAETVQTSSTKRMASSFAKRFHLALPLFDGEQGKGRAYFVLSDLVRALEQVSKGTRIASAVKLVRQHAARLIHPLLVKLHHTAVGTPAFLSPGNLPLFLFCDRHRENRFVACLIFHFG